MKCPFCIRDNKLSKEHLFSKPICDAFGIDRSMPVVSFDLNTRTMGRSTTLDAKSVRLPCEGCNSGWMNDLERRAAAIFGRWIAESSETLTTGEVGDIRRWLAKTAIVLAFGEVDARRFIENPTETAVPDITTAKAVMRGDSLDHVVVGAARTRLANFGWGVGNPTVTPSGPDRISCRMVNVMVLNLPPLQLWTVIPIVRPDRVTLPPNVWRFRENLSFGALPLRSGRDIQPTRVVASYSDRTTRASIAALESLVS
jgi:hypothetical protein